MTTDRPPTLAKRKSRAKTRPESVAFLDPQMSDDAPGVAGVIAGSEVVRLVGDRDGIEQITATLAQYSNIHTVHIICHGAPGCLWIGTTRLNPDTLERYAWDLQSWFAGMTQPPAIRLYGCDVAAGAIGQTFLQQIQLLTGAEVIASD